MTGFDLQKYLQERFTSQVGMILKETGTPETIWAAKIRINELGRLASNAGIQIKYDISVEAVVETK